MTLNARYHVVGVTPFRKSTKSSFASLAEAREAYDVACSEHNDAALIASFPTKNVVVLAYDGEALRPAELCRRIGLTLPGTHALAVA